jgi:hypothetical protein
MGWKEWSAVAVVIGGGILLQIPGHDDMDMDHAVVDHEEMEPGEVSTDPAEAQGAFSTVTLAVIGMT